MKDVAVTTNMVNDYINPHFGWTPVSPGKIRNHPAWDVPVPVPVVQPVSPYYINPYTYGVPMYSPNVQHYHIYDSDGVAEKETPFKMVTAKEANEEAKKAKVEKKPEVKKEKAATKVEAPKAPAPKKVEAAAPAKKAEEPMQPIAAPAAKPAAPEEPLVTVQAPVIKKKKKCKKKVAPLAKGCLTANCTETP